MNVPTMQVTGPQGRVVRINVSDRAEWEARGYKEYVPEQPKQDAPPAPPEPVKLTLAELREKAAGLGILNAKKLGEAELLKAIAEVEGKEGGDSKQGK